MWIKKLTRSLLYILPSTLFFSYWPLIKLGSSESMNFELSLPLIWLVVFDAVGVVILIQRRKLFDWLKGWRWLWLLFPVWVTLSVIWSLNVVRGVLTVGIMWLLYLAGYVMWLVKDWLDDGFKLLWLKWFFGSTLVICVWCVVQCILDLAGVGQEYSLMCDGCTYHMFGFPHPNGFAIEPQFMGNLLLAPIMASIWLFLEDDCNSTFRTWVAPARRHGRSALSLGRDLRNVLKVLLPIVFVATLFLTFSRGAIYAFVVGMLFMSGFVIFGIRQKERRLMVKRVGVVWGLIVLSFVAILNLQGLMAEMGPTSDTYYDGVAKVINHLSLGVIDIRVDKPINEDIETENMEGELKEDEFVLVENSVENFEKEEAVFGGYVAESTDTRVRLSGAAMEVWSQSWSNMIFGVGLGGAGFALYNNGLSPAPKEIVQNEYASLLLETGLIGVSLIVLTLILIFKAVWKKSTRVMLLGLLVSYGASLMFFSGLPNALHVYLLPMILAVLPNF